jgi:protein-tyrosine phosphatase
MTSVLFVCLGNICRSPMAEAVFRHYVEKANLSDEIHIDSAGTGDWHVGEIPHRGTRSKLDEKGISYEGIRARQVVYEDLKKYDYIIGMDDDNIQALRSLAGKSGANIYRFVDFVPSSGYSEVPDPWYTGNFDETYRLIDAGCRNLLKEIMKKT